jgi:hypothetical protein
MSPLATDPSWSPASGWQPGWRTSLPSWSEDTSNVPNRALVDGSPILVASVLPAIVLGFGRLDLVSDATARIAAIVVAVIQLLAIGAFVAQVAPAPPAARWTFAAATAGVGVAVVALTVLLGH